MASNTSNDYCNITQSLQYYEFLLKTNSFLVLNKILNKKSEVFIVAPTDCGVRAIKGTGGKNKPPNGFNKQESSGTANTNDPKAGDEISQWLTIWD